MGTLSTRGTAAFVASFLAAHPGRAPSQTAPPVTTRIEIGRDTVRFVNDDGVVRTRFGYVRASGAWIRLDRPPGRWRTRIPAPDSAVSLGGGWRLARRLSERSQPRDVLIAPDGREIDLVPMVDSATFREIVQTTGESEANVIRGLSGFSRGIQDWRHEADTIWMATWGNWASLLKFDVAQRKLETFATGWVANGIVASMATTRRAVWLAFRHRSGIGGRGLARFDRATRTWSHVIPDAALPDSEIVAMDGAGDTLWIATREALAAFDEVKGAWDVAWFRAVPAIVERREERFGNEWTDSVIRPRWELARSRDPREPATRVIIDVARHLETVSPLDEDRPLDAVRFLDVARSLPPEHFARAWDSHRRHDGIPESDLGLAMAHPRLLPFILRDSASTSTLPSAAELRALGLLGDRRYLPYVQWASRTPSSDPLVDATTAWARARLGDTTWLPLLRDLAVHRGWRWTSNWMADALLELGDTVIVDHVLDRIRREYVVWPLDWLQQRVSRERWLKIVREAADTPSLHATVVIYLGMYAHPSVHADSSIAADLQRCANGVLAALADDSSFVPETRRDLVSAITSFALRRREAAMIPGLIALVASDSATYVSMTNALIHLTAVDTVPGTPGSDAAGRVAVQRFWQRWWLENRATFAPADPRLGDAAATRWWRRASG